MSDFLEDGLRQKEVTLQTLSNLAAVQQRNQLIAQQERSRAEMERQTQALQEQNRLEKDRAQIEAQRLRIEQQRLDAEKADRELRRLQGEQVRQLRNLMAELDSEVAGFRRRHLGAKP